MSSTVCYVGIILNLFASSCLADDIDYSYKLEGGNTFEAGLYPMESETRQVKTLDGIWNFRLSPKDPNYGLKHKWFNTDLYLTGPVIKMPVPSSYNDITTEAEIRDHSGFVWYDRRFYIPMEWLQGKRRIWLRFDSVHYIAKVWVNGNEAMYHEMGHLPFEGDISHLVNATNNLVTVACDNTLTYNTIPQGYLQVVNTTDGIRTYQQYTFDFFNYAGIHRSVRLYTTPLVYIKDIIVNTDIQGVTGLVTYQIEISSDGESQDSIKYQVELFDSYNNIVTASSKPMDVLDIPNAKLWWPYLMNDDVGYLYTLQVSILGDDSTVLDIYREKIGIRKVIFTKDVVTINGEPLYMRGFGMHEDSDIRGKGWDLPLWTRNFNLLKWVGANSFRTSHYPYAEEIYRMADEEGIMIIDECPGVDLTGFHQKLLNKHKQAMLELIRRDKNHPSVVMWSVANEARTAQKEAGPYFAEIANFTKSLDPSRPITMAIAVQYYEDNGGKSMDIIMFNRYQGWYQNPGKLELISKLIKEEALNWRVKFKKPVLISEYGADTYAGLHLLPSYIWSEEYQNDLFSEYYKAFDQLREEGFFMGEFVWNFADFKTAQGYTRVGGNKKGVFTRERQPKNVAYLLRNRYYNLAHIDTKAKLPKDLNRYVYADRRYNPEL